MNRLADRIWNSEIERYNSKLIEVKSIHPRITYFDTHRPTALIIEKVKAIGLSKKSFEFLYRIQSKTGKSQDKIIVHRYMFLFIPEIFI